MPTPINEPIRVTLARVEEKVDVLIYQRTDLENRLRRAEKWMYGLPVTLIVAAAGLITAAVRHT